MVFLLLGRGRRRDSGEGRSRGLFPVKSVLYSSASLFWGPIHPGSLLFPVTPPPPIGCPG